MSNGVAREPLYARARDGALADAKRAIAMAIGGASAFALVEYGLTVWTYAGPVRIACALRLAALVVTLSILLGLALALGLSIATVGTRMARGAFDPDAARGAGCFAAPPAVDGVRTGVPRAWANLATAAVFGVVVQQAAGWGIVRFKEPALAAGWIAGVALVVAASAAALRPFLRMAFTSLARAVAPRLGSASPFGRWRAAGIALSGLGGAGLAALWVDVPAMRSVLPVRLAISATTVALGMGLGALAHARLSPRRETRRTWLALAAAAGALMTATLCAWVRTWKRSTSRSPPRPRSVS